MLSCRTVSAPAPAKLNRMEKQELKNKREVRLTDLVCIHHFDTVVHDGASKVEMYIKEKEKIPDIVCNLPMG